MAPPQAKYQVSRYAELLLPDPAAHDGDAQSGCLKYLSNIA